VHVVGRDAEFGDQLADRVGDRIELRRTPDLLRREHAGTPGGGDERTVETVVPLAFPDEHIDMRAQHAFGAAREHGYRAIRDQRFPCRRGEGTAEVVDTAVAFCFADDGGDVRRTVPAGCERVQTGDVGGPLVGRVRSVTALVRCRPSFRGAKGGG
jgi:hypothetical protein